MAVDIDCRLQVCSNQEQLISGLVLYFWFLFSGGVSTSVIIIDVAYLRDWTGLFCPFLGSRCQFDYNPIILCWPGVEGRPFLPIRSSSISQTLYLVSLACPLFPTAIRASRLWSLWLPVIIWLQSSRFHIWNTLNLSWWSCKAPPSMRINGLCPNV